MRSKFVVTVLLCTALGIAQKKEQPLGLVLEGQGARVLRAGTESSLGAQPGDVLFAGDSLAAEGGPAKFLYYPDKSQQTLAQGGEVVFEAKQLRVKKGTLGDKKTVEYSFLPELERSPAAGKEQYRTLDVPQQEGTLESRVAKLAADKQSALRAELAPLDKVLVENPNDQIARLHRAEVLSKYGLAGDAAEEYKKVRQAWGGAEWVRQLVHGAETKQEPAQDGEGKTYALLIGISKYQRLTKEQQLQYAHADAELFEKFLRSPRGGSLKDDQIILLTDEKATSSGIRAAIERMLKVKVGKKDTFVLFVAAHGTVDREGYIVTNDSDPQDLASTALPMNEIQGLMRERLTKMGRVLIYVDVCHAGIIGTIKSNNINESVEGLFQPGTELVLFMATRPQQYSIEAPRFGGGHGAFSYFLMRGLNGDADKSGIGNGDNVVTANEVIEYVRSQVIKETKNRQIPNEKVSAKDDPELAQIEREGIQLAALLPPEPTEGKTRFIAAVLRPGPEAGAGAPQIKPRSPTANDLELFDGAMEAGRVLPETAGSAFDPLRRLKQRLPKEQYLALESLLRVELENRGQQVLLRYLTGDQVPQTRASFDSGSLYFRAAQLITPDSPFLRSRETFCYGRVAIFDKRYPQAVQMLETAIRQDPNGAFSYNALGIAYLEQGNYERAIEAFHDAAKRAPYWAYPLHNLALALTETGDYEGAIRTYEQAMRLAPQYSYLPYNLGLVYQRLNRRRESETAFRKAAAISPELGEPYNALGFLFAAAGKTAEAQKNYETAIQKNAELWPARHNLAVLLAEKRGQTKEAIEEWRKILEKSPDFLPSRLSLAEALAKQHQEAEAVEQYEAALKQKPEYLAARLALADALEASGKADAAMEQLQMVLKQKPQSAQAYERMGDIEKKRGRSSEALAAYQKALESAADPEAKKRVRGKMKG